MPKGISESFLRLLDEERPRATRVLIWTGVLALAALALADLADAPRLGRVSMTYLALLGCGVALGAAWGRMAAQRLLARLGSAWSHTMRDAAGVEGLAGLDRKLRGAGPVPSWRAPVVAVAAVAANVLLFALLWVDHADATFLSYLVLGVDALLLGSLAGAALHHLLFARSFVREVDAMVSRGTLGVWGEA